MNMVVYYLREKLVNIKWRLENEETHELLSETI